MSSEQFFIKQELVTYKPHLLPGTFAARSSPPDKPKAAKEPVSNNHGAVETKLL